MERTVDREINHTPGPSALTHSLLTRGKKSLVNKRPLSPVTSSYFTLSRYPLVTGWKYFGTETSQDQAPRTQHFSSGVKAAACTGVSVSQLAFHIS